MWGAAEVFCAGCDEGCVWLECWYVLFCGADVCVCTAGCVDSPWFVPVAFAVFTGGLT